MCLIWIRVHRRSFASPRRLGWSIRRTLGRKLNVWPVRRDIFLRSGVPDTRYPSVPTEHSCHDESAREESYGPLSCLTFEVLRCTTLEEMEKMVATALGVTWPRDIRLWVITQPTTDCPLAPRQLLR